MENDIAPQIPAPVRRILLTLISLVVAVVMGSALVASWNEPQVASRLELYQTDLLLQASAWETDEPSEQVEYLKENLLGNTPLKAAQQAYESVRETASDALKGGPDPEEIASPRLQSALVGQGELLDLLDLRLGILHAEQGQLKEAAAAWESVQSRQAQGSPQWQVANTLTLLWQSDDPAALSEQPLSVGLNGWFRYRALERFHGLNQADDEAAQLQQAERRTAARAVLILAVVQGLPAIGTLTGIVILLVVVVQRVLKGADSLLAMDTQFRWNPPWTAETIWLVLVAGFFFMGQLVVPIVISPLRGSLAAFGIRGQALYALLYYGLMSAGGVTVLGFAIRTYRPLPEKERWFSFQGRGNWPLWGIGGYLVALPLMLTVAVVNQRIWQGQGGSNPLLQTVLEAQDPVALSLFFFTAAIAAPLFEEFLFRGFLLPSLTRYMPMGGAIVLSSFIFAVAHLSLSEILPLMTLGIILGVVYTRSRNLLSPMLLHSAWNSITMLGLFLLGSSAG